LPGVDADLPVLALLVEDARRLVVRMEKLIEQGFQVDAEQVADAVADYLDKNPIDAVTSEELEAEVRSALQAAAESGEFKGDRGEPFTYEDFTPEQLEELKGDPGYTPIKGKDYFDGNPGYTPVKGLDYFTAAEKAEIAKDASDLVKVPVTSVNGKTGVVVLNAGDVGALPADTPIPAKTSELTNDSGFITKAVSDLTSYYLKSETYTRDEINQRISAIPKFAISVVSALPTSGISETTIYLVGGGDGSDLYTEYIRVNGAWEILGSQRVDLTGYATEAWVGTQLAGYQPAGNYALKSEIPTVPTKLSQLSGDSTHRVVTDAEKETWNGKSNFSGSYNDLTNKPTNVSAFENDAEYVTNKPGLVTERVDSSLYGWIEGYYCNIDNGGIYQVGHYAVTDYLEIGLGWSKIIAHASAYGDSAGICFYDSTKKFISGDAFPKTDAITELEYDIPGSAAYVCISTKKSDMNTTFVEVVKYTDGVLNRISALEKQVGTAHAISYGLAASNVLCIGDSLTAGAYYAGDSNGAAIAQNYPYYLGRMLNCRTVNAGRSGYSASDWYNEYINDYTYADYDTIIIWLGTNYGCTEMPTDDEISAFVPSSLDSAETANQALYLIKIIQTIQAANASCHIVLCNVFGSKSDKTANNEVVQQIAIKYGCQLVDMSDLSYSNRPELHAGINNPHFGKSGNIFVAYRMASEIDSYIAADPLLGEFGITTNPMPTLTESEKDEIIADVIASLPVYNGEVV